MVVRIPKTRKCVKFEQRTVIHMQDIYMHKFLLMFGPQKCSIEALNSNFFIIFIINFITL